MNLIMTIVAMQKWLASIWLLFLLATSLGGSVYYLLAIFCTIRLRQRSVAKLIRPLPALGITLLKPLHGAEPELRQCLQSFFEQDYESYEIIFAMRTSADPAVGIVEALCAQFPAVKAKLIFTGEPPYANAKVYSMELMTRVAQFDILAITDSDTLVSNDYLQHLAAVFADEKVGAMTNLYRGEASNELWAKLEALGMSTEFMAGVVVAEKLEGMKFALGPSMAIRRQCLNDIGGFAAMKDYLADDFVLGNWADAAGWRVVLSSYVIQHFVSTTGFYPTFMHRLRWNRSTRFSRPAGYIGQGFTYGLSWALLLALSFPTALSVLWLGCVLVARAALAVTLGSGLLDDRQVIKRWWMLPLQDAISFASWIGGWMSREIVWRGERYRLLADGKFSPVKPRITSSTRITSSK